MNPYVDHCPIHMPIATLSSWRDHELPVDVMQQVQQHVATCPACQAYLANYETDGRANRTINAPPMQDAIWGDVQPQTVLAPRHDLLTTRRIVLSSIAATLLIVLLFVVIINTQARTSGQTLTMVPTPTAPLAGTLVPTATVDDATPTATDVATAIPTSVPVIFTPTATITPVTSMKEVSASLPITDSSTQDYSVSASCSGSQVMLGGGFSIDGDGNAQKAQILASYPSSATTWTVTETNSAGGAMTLSAYAECLTANFPVTAQINGVTGTIAGCGGNTFNSGGGFKQDHDNASVVDINAQGGNYWGAEQYQSSGNLHTYAICVSQRTLNQRTGSGNSITVPNGATGSASGSCQSGDILASGGYIHLGSSATNFSPINYYHALSDHANSSMTAWIVTVADIGGPASPDREAVSIVCSYVTF